VVERIKACTEAQDATRIFIDYWNRAGSFDAAPAAAQDKMAGMIAKVRATSKPCWANRPHWKICPC
jgi:hypothetical protein